MKPDERQNGKQTTAARTIFITGATGNIGAALVARLLKQDSTARLILLVRGRTPAIATQRVMKAVRFLNPQVDLSDAAGRITVLNGDITQERLGLTEPLWDGVASEITEIVHCAATTRFVLPLACARAINCEGTANVLKLVGEARGNGQLDQMVHISTAFVCGDRGGRIYESDTSRPGRFSNAYEQTKWEGEQLVRRHMAELPISIVRPSVVVGDSRTGRTTAFNVLYTPLRLIREGQFKYIPCVPESRLDVVPLDYVADVITQVTLNCDRAVGRTFHLVAGEGRSLSTREIVSRALSLFKREGGSTAPAGVRLISPALYRLARSLVSRRTRRARQLVDPYLAYLTTPRQFDSTNTRELLGGTPWQPPSLESYLETILDYALRTNWGRLRPAIPKAA